MNCRFLICIPVYNNSGTVVAVAERCRAASNDTILIVDDGSAHPIEALFTPGQIASLKLHFVRHNENQGKGTAIQTAIKWGIEREFTHLVTIDGDGQHEPQDISILTDCAQKDPWSLVVGDRVMKGEYVPKSSKFGKKFSNFWVRYQTDALVADSQCGFRLYPLFYLQTMHFYCKRYDFEIEVLIRLLWRGVRVQNPKISVYYPPPSERVTHFHKGKDNFRLTILNTVLTTAAIFRQQTHRGKSAAAMGLGVFIGCLPLFGLHTGLAILLSLLFRLNFVYMWVGTNISIPPMIPFLILGSEFFGKKLFPDETMGQFGFAKAWLAGSVCLGLILGLTTFLVVWLLKQPKSKTWTGKNRNPAGVMFMRTVMRTLGIRVAYLFLYPIAFYYFLLSWRTRKSFTEYWKITHPEIGFWHRQVKLYLQLLVFAQSLVDRGFQRAHEDLKFDSIMDESSSEAQEILKNPIGIVCVASHFGGWELVMRFLGERRSSKELMGVTNAMSDQYRHKSVEGHVLHFNETKNSVFHIRQHVEAGNVIGMMADRPVTRSYQLVPFFGKLAAIDCTAIRLGLACKAELVIVFTVKESLKRYRIFLFRPKAKDVDGILREYVRHYEEMIRRYPEQWFNFFPFWSTEPKQIEDSPKPA